MNSFFFSFDIFRFFPREIEERIGAFKRLFSFPLGYVITLDDDQRTFAIRQLIN